jgi:hypothetical protein
MLIPVMWSKTDKIFEDGRVKDDRVKDGRVYVKQYVGSQ